MSCRGADARSGVRDGEPTGRRRSKTEAMRAKTDESPSIKSKMDDVAEAVAAVKAGVAGSPAAPVPLSL